MRPYRITPIIIEAAFWMINLLTATMIILVVKKESFTFSGMLIPYFKALVVCWWASTSLVAILQALGKSIGANLVRGIPYILLCAEFWYLRSL